MEGECAPNGGWSARITGRADRMSVHGGGYARTRGGHTARSRRRVEGCHAEPAGRCAAGRPAFWLGRGAACEEQCDCARERCVANWLRGGTDEPCRFGRD